MPIVNRKHFPYTQAGKKAAVVAKRTMPDGPVKGEKIVRKAKYRMTDGGKMKY